MYCRNGQNLIPLYDFMVLVYYVLQYRIKSNNLEHIVGTVNWYNQ
jgi:hypothetical protein